MAKKSVIIYGHLCIDRNSLEGKVQPQQPGSPAYFVSLIFGQLDVATTIVSVIGTDYPLKWLSHTKLIPDKPSVKKSLEYQNIYQKGNRKLIAQNVDNVKNIPPNLIPKLSLKNASAVVLSPLLNDMSVEDVTYFKKNSPKDTLIMCMPQGFFRKVHKNGKVTETEWENAVDYLEHIDLVCLSEEDGNNIDNHAKTWSELSTIVVTRSDKGCSIYRKKQRKDIPAVKISPIIDQVGAGDVFASALVFSLLEGQTIEHAARYANAAAGVSLKYHADQIKISTTAIQDLLNQKL